MSPAPRSPASSLYAEVIGDPIVQSKSPAIHGYWLRRLGLDAEEQVLAPGVGRHEPAAVQERGTRGEAALRRRDA